MTSTLERGVPPELLARVEALSPEQRAELLRLARPRVVEPYMKHIPHPIQQVFLGAHDKEVMFGGAAGGGKSDALLMSAMQYVDVPGYSALILRRTWPDLNAPGAILDRAKTWLMDTDAHMRESGRIWEFPGGGRIQFGYLQYDNDKYKFQSAEYQFIGFDELTQFDEATYLYLFSRLRRPAITCLNCNTNLRGYRAQKGGLYYKHTSAVGKRRCDTPFPDPAQLKQYGAAPQDKMTLFDVPLRMRTATNPGGIGHLWVRSRFIDQKTRKATARFIPSLLSDNPSLDQASYEESLMHLTPVDRERLLAGDWDVMEEGAMFERHWFDVVDEYPRRNQGMVRYWDMASTVNDDSDWTVGALIVQGPDGVWYIADIRRLQGRPHEVERAIQQTALLDTVHVPVRMEQEPGSSGVSVISHYRRNILPGFNFDGIRSTGSKEVRAGVLSSSAEAHNVKLVKGRWNVDFLDEATLFPNGAHDDQIDACAGGVNHLAFGKRSRLLA